METLEDLEQFAAMLLTDLPDGLEVAGFVLTRSNRNPTKLVPEGHPFFGVRIFTPLDPRLAGLVVRSADGENGLAFHQQGENAWPRSTNSLNSSQPSFAPQAVA